MALTVLDMAEATAKKLFILAAGEELDATTAADLKASVTNTYEMLRDMEVCYWDDGAAPNALRDPLALYIACQCADEHIPEQAAQFKAVNEIAALRKIRDVSALRERTDRPTRAEYF